MPEAMKHPTPQELTDFGLGKLPERTAVAVAAHLESCPPCLQVVAGVLPDSFLDKLRAAKSDGSSFPPSVPPPAISNVPRPDVPPELMRHPKYLILRELGRGGMGVVYQARQTMMNRQVVIKVINRALLEQSGALERFHREIQAAAQLSHPNIVTAYDAEQAGTLHMLVMEFVPGQSLAEVLEKKGSLPVANACHYMCQAALGLQHAHERNMVHRDIKPSNLMLTPKGQVKILDFGLAKIISERDTNPALTASNAYMGTPDYCAPEQAQNARTADIRADLYSLGCTLYCLLAGRPPFREDTPVNTILAHVQKQPQPLPELRPDVPAELWQVVKRLLAKDPAQRYQKPNDVFRALSVFVKPGAKPEAKNGSSPTKRAPAVWSRLWPALAGAGIMLLVMLGLWRSDVLKTPDEIKELSKEQPSEPPKITNSIGMELVLVKRGTFFMGSPENEVNRHDNEFLHKVEITQSFYVGKYEVTQGQYERVVHENPSCYSPKGDGKKLVQGEDTQQFPVEKVSWDDAVKFCRQLSELPAEKSNRRRYRLPTEAEWEYCCRGGHFCKEPSPPFHFGNSLSSTQANFDGNWPYEGVPKGPFRKCTTKVGSYRANPHPLDIYDLHGNVREWCSDWYDSEYYHRSPRQNPQEREKRSDRVLRGGSWFSMGQECRAAHRGHYDPDAHLDTIGFRVVFDFGAKN